MLKSLYKLKKIRLKKAQNVKITKPNLAKYIAEMSRKYGPRT